MASYFANPRGEKYSGESQMKRGGANLPRNQQHIIIAAGAVAMAWPFMLSQIPLGS